MNNHHKGKHMKYLISLVLSFSLFVSAAHARSAVPIEPQENIPVPAVVSATVTPEKVRHAFIVAGAQRGWTFTDAGEGKLKGKLEVRDKHSATVEVTYDAKKYSVRYLDSYNLKYEVLNGVAQIHPFYNKWVKALIEDVNRNLIAGQ